MKITPQLKEDYRELLKRVDWNPLQYLIMSVQQNCHSPEAVVEIIDNPILFAINNYEESIKKCLDCDKECANNKQYA